MLLFQIVIPAVLVFITFIIGHFFISSSGSGLYLSELNIENEEVSEVPEDINPIDVDPETGLILPDKYNYLKIENVFSGFWNSHTLTGLAPFKSNFIDL